MSRLPWILCLTIATAHPACSAELLKAPLQDLQIAPAAIARAEALITGQINRQDVAGVSVCVLRKGRIAHLKAYGYRDALSKLPARVDDIVRIYSMSKRSCQSRPCNSGNGATSGSTTRSPTTSPRFDT